MGSRFRMMDQGFRSKDRRLLFILGLLTLAATAVLFLRYFTPEWMSYQREFRSVVEKKFGAQRAARIREGVQQVWVKELDRVDRCATCHLGIEWDGLEGAPQPFRSHPKEILKSHPIAKYGCTICHGGQGYATGKAAGHGLVKDWEEPLLGGELAKYYLINDRSALMQVNCNGCHRYDRETKGADYINHAKNLVRDKGCRACHQVNGRGGVVGPSLTYVGDKSPEQNDYARIRGSKSLFTWHVNHFKNPKESVPETVMPNFGFTSRDAQALALLMLSWRRVDLPLSYMHGDKPADKSTPEELEKESAMMTGEGAFFVKKGCFACHSVSSLGIKAPAEIGPDLANAYTDVQSRFSKTLEDFLSSPTGTMAVVLSTQIVLTDAEKREAIERLKLAYTRKAGPPAK